MASRVGFSGSWRTVVAPSTLLQKRLSLGHLLHSIRRLQLPHVPLSSTAVMERAMPTDHSEDKDAVPRPSRAKVQVYRRPRFRLTLDTVNPNVREMEYAVRGRLPLEAAAIDEDIRSVSGSTVVYLPSRPPMLSRLSRSRPRTFSTHALAVYRYWVAKERAL